MCCLNKCLGNVLSIVTLISPHQSSFTIVDYLFMACWDVTHLFRDVGQKFRSPILYPLCLIPYPLIWLYSICRHQRNPAKPYSLEPFLYDSLQFYIIITSISAAEKEALQNEASGERALRTATSSAAISLRLPLRKPRRQLTPEELEERRIKVCTLT